MFADTGAASGACVGEPTAGRTVSFKERAEFYDTEYSETIDQAFLRSLVTSRVDSILEVPCGAGRNAAWLAETQKLVVCADVEPSMVSRVEQRIEALGAGERVSPVVADMRRLDLGTVFDLILVPQEAFQLLTDPKDALHALMSLRDHLAPGGTLLIDLFAFAPDDRGNRLVYPDYYDPEREDGELIPEWSRRLSTGRELVRSRVQHRAGCTARVDYFYELVEEDRTVDRWRSEIRLRTYDFRCFAELLREANLKMVRAYRDYSGEPYAPGAARTVALIGHRGPGGRG